MRKPGCAAAVIFCALATHAQTPAELQRSLETALKGKPLPIRGFLGAQVIHYAWKTDHMERNSEDVHTVGVFQAESVKVRGSHGQVSGITIQGSRGTVLKDASGAYAVSKAASAVTFEIEVSGITDVELAKIPNQLFFPDIETAVKAIPAELASTLPARDTPYTAAELKQNSAIKGRPWIQELGAWRQLAEGEEPVAPKVLKPPSKVELEVLQGASRLHKVSGKVLITILVTAEGKVGDAWLDRPLGQGIDEKELYMLSLYRFVPASYNGNAVGFVMTIEVEVKDF